MISDKKLAVSFTSFWQELLPAGDSFIRSMNLNTERYDTPLDSKVSAVRRALINETGFLVYVASLKEHLSIDQVEKSKLFGDVSLTAWNHVKGFEEQNDPTFKAMNKVEGTEVKVLAQRLEEFFVNHESGKPIVPSPMFAGCGFIDDCAGDILAGDVLYEVKAGDRKFRLVDIRQVLVCLALNHSRERYRITQVGLLNPRLGVFYKIRVNDLTQRISGTSPTELFSEIIEFVSSGGVSK